MRTKVLGTIMRNHLTAATLLGAVVLLGSAGAARAGSISIVGGSVAPPNTWATEPGQSMPTGVAGFVGGLVVAGGAGNYTFTYGGGGLVGGDTGHGNSVFPNEFWVGATEGVAEGAGHVFCTQAGDASCGGGAATAVGTQFTVALGSGAIPFGFTYGPNHIAVLLNGGVDPANGAYLAQIGTGNAPFAGSGSSLVGYLGLSDSPYPGDADFQDLVVRVSTTPEPASLLVMGVGLIGLAYVRRRKNS